MTDFNRPYALINHDFSHAEDDDHHEKIAPIRSYNLLAFIAGSRSYSVLKRLQRARVGNPMKKLYPNHFTIQVGDTTYSRIFWLNSLIMLLWDTEVIWSIPFL